MQATKSMHAQAVEGRDPSFVETDKTALQALVQAAINVELFTIPLYMVTMYSIHGMHEINASKQTFYKGRTWPGAATSRAPHTANEKAFNILFSVFIEEMLHLQLASNVAAVVGVAPCFTSTVLQSKEHGWKCYGPDESVIPHIIDLKDTIPYKDVKVALGPLDEDRIRLLIAIEEPEKDAKARIEPSKINDYFPSVPFEGWTPQKTETDLPMFGTIGYMYECLAVYLGMRYSDGTTLLSRVLKPKALQRDLFNTRSGSHPMAEYPGFPSVVSTTDVESALVSALDILNAITDQGEGGKIPSDLRAKLTGQPPSEASSVDRDYRSSAKALEADYPSYDAAGARTPHSADAIARAPNDREDHYGRFLRIQSGLLRDVITWDMWHKTRGQNPWTPADLLSGPDEASPKIPKPEAVAGALNRLLAKDTDGSVWDQLSKVAVGSIAGVTTVLDGYWNDPTKGFPFPAMGGSGDRVSICWAVLGKAPDLRRGTANAVPNKLYHACQGLDFTSPGKDVMPDVTTYHTCIGSNNCMAQGGCGFVQSVKGGGSCSGSGGGGGGCSTKIGGKGGCGAPTVYSAPADNKCNGFGGCAVPISASQLYPKGGDMLLFEFQGGGFQQVGGTTFNVGDPVYDVAWRSYCEVLQKSGVTPPTEPPVTDDLRLALPPST